MKKTAECSCTYSLEDWLPVLRPPKKKKKKEKRKGKGKRKGLVGFREVFQTRISPLCVNIVKRKEKEKRGGGEKRTPEACVFCLNDSRGSG